MYIDCMYMRYAKHKHKFDYEEREREIERERERQEYIDVYMHWVLSSI